MRRLACGLLLLAAMAAPAAAQAPDEAPKLPPGVVGSLVLPKEPWPTLQDARSSSRCDDSGWEQEIARIKAADPEQEAEKQIAAGDFSLKSGGLVTTMFRFRWVKVRDPHKKESDLLVAFENTGAGGTKQDGPVGVQCRVPVSHTKVFPGLQRPTPQIALVTWCGRAMLILEEDYAVRFNRHVVGHQAYPLKDICSVHHSSDRGQSAWSVSDRPKPDMVPPLIPDIVTAARFGLTDQVAKFISDGADLGQRDIFDFDALKWSVVRDYRAAFDLIIAAGGTPDFCDALKAAVDYNRAAPIAELAQRCIIPGKRWELLNPAVKRGELAIVKALIDSEPALQLGETSEAQRLLSISVSLGHVELARLLLDRISPAQWEDSRQGLLMTALGRKSSPMIRLLLERGADPGPALRLAVRRKTHEAVRTLAELGADLNAALPPQLQKTAVVAGVQFDPLGRQLHGNERIERLADPPMFEALHPLLDFKMVDLLLELGASPNVRDVSGRTPLMIAITHSQIYGKKGGASWIERFVPQKLLEGQEDWEHRGVEPVRALLAKGADVKLADNAGLTALHHAARSDYCVDIARILLVHGADIDARDKAGKTPLDHAVEAGLMRMPDLLAKAGARRAAH
jgi:ankyrin repeat protein